MVEIAKFEFTEGGIEEIGQNNVYNQKWPIVYIIHNEAEAYVGETVDAKGRMANHFSNPDRSNLKHLKLIFDAEFNKSATLDIESFLIKYMASDGKYILQNGNMGLVSHDYFQKEKYKIKFDELWDLLIAKNLAKNQLAQIDNSDLFKYSPYKTLTEDQFRTIAGVLTDIIAGLNGNKSNIPLIIEGGAGTGKTVLAIFLMKLLRTEIKEEDYLEKLDDMSGNMDILKKLEQIKSKRTLEIGLVIPMTSLRKTIKQVFRFVSGLKPSMVLGPGDVAKKRYDVLIVDEAHRLSTRGRYGIIAKTNRKLGLNEKTGTQLDWILKQSTFQVLFYDSGQSIKPADVKAERFDNLVGKAKRYTLTSQLRVKDKDYIGYVDTILESSCKQKKIFANYEFKLFEKIKDMVEEIKEKDEKYGLSRMIAGFGWEWKTQGGKPGYDFRIEDVDFRWNSTTEDWVNSPNAAKEVGCIHTTQGYDLNYAGVILGPEVSYDKQRHTIIVDRKKYFDRNGKPNAVYDKGDKQLLTYIKNIYRTLMSRGISGTYVYACDASLREYLKKWITENKVIRINQQYDTQRKEGYLAAGEDLKLQRAAEKEPEKK